MCPACLLRLASAPASHIPAFEIETLLGAGTAMTYLARGRGRNVLLAVKVFETPAGDVGEDMEAQLETLSGTLSELSHPNIARTYGIHVDNRVQLVRDFVPGKPLIDWSEARTDIADAIAAAHQAGVAHGHLVTGNIVVVSGKAVVLDFGAAAAREILAGRSPDFESMRRADLAVLARAPEEPSE